MILEISFLILWFVVAVEAILIIMAIKKFNGWRCKFVSAWDEQFVAIWDELGRIHTLIDNLPNTESVDKRYESLVAGQTKILAELSDQCGSRSHRILYGRIIEILEQLNNLNKKPRGSSKGGR